MLDADTKRKIDNCRDILVGKIPDPKSQVEQITIALIYKFMDDMDKESEEMGGNASFFTGEYKKYSWSKIFDPRLGGHDLINLYGEAITKMNLNKNIPQLFRDIFKNAFLPYRDPETLKSFLKEINEFSYDHSERLGDAFEYLLSVLSSQGEAGQFRTPRHIIDFIVGVVDPKKGETMLDPACGTAGFLISSYKNILKANTSLELLKNGVNGTYIGDLLSPDDKKRLMESFEGYDISPDMVRLSLVNMYLHGFPSPRIHEYDTLTSEDRWVETFDVILANPPFMSPKGGIRPHRRFSIQANRSEVLFVDYIAEHLAIYGRAGVIVPEGIIFQSANAYKALRKMLVEQNYLWAVASLPAGVFNPYSGVKTSILFMDKVLAEKTNDILFVKIENDGFDLGAQRRPIDKNDLPEALEVLKKFNKDLTLRDRGDGKVWSIIVSKSRLAENGDYNLSGDRYRETKVHANREWPLVELGEVCEFVRGVTYNKDDESFIPTNIIVLRANNIDNDYHILNLNDLKYLKNDTNLPKEKKLIQGDIFICTASGSKNHLGKVAFIHEDTSYYFGGFMGVVRSLKNIYPSYLFYNLTSAYYSEFIQGLTAGVNINNLKGSDLLTFKIPLPPLEIQKEIVAEIEGYQKIIDGARQVVENYKPLIQIDPVWPLVELGDVCEFYSGGTPSKSKSEYWNGSIPWVSPKDMKSELIIDSEDHISEIAVQESATKKVPKDTILCVVRSGILSHTFPVCIAGTEVSFNQDIAALKVKKIILSKFAYLIIKQNEQEILSTGVKRGGTVHSLQNGFLKQFKIPLPPLEIQQEIVARIEQEQKLVDANKELVNIFEKKIKDKITAVW